MNSDEATLYENLGGEAGIRRLVESFYHRVDTLPEAKPIRDMHRDLESSKEKLFCFLSGWSGGPQLFMERFGHPMLRARHLPFPIGAAERDQWLLCMKHAIADVGLSEQLGRELMNSFSRVADHMRNRGE